MFQPDNRTGDEGFSNLDPSTGSPASGQTGWWPLGAGRVLPWMWLFTLKTVNIYLDRSGFTQQDERDCQPCPLRLHAISSVGLTVPRMALQVRAAVQALQPDYFRHRTRTGSCPALMPVCICRRRFRRRRFRHCFRCFLRRRRLLLRYLSLPPPLLLPCVRTLVLHAFALSAAPASRGCCPH